MTARALVLALAICGCTSGSQEEKAPPTIASTWQDDTVVFTWTWTTDVDAFDVIIIRDGMHEPQTEIGGETRTLNVPVNGAKMVGIALQACEKGLLSSSCTDWTEADATR